MIIYHLPTIKGTRNSSWNGSKSFFFWVSGKPLDLHEGPTVFWSKKSSWPHGFDPFTPQNVAFWKGNGTPTISGKSRLVKYYTLARILYRIIPYHMWIAVVCIFYFVGSKYLYKCPRSRHTRAPMIKSGMSDGNASRSIDGWIHIPFALYSQSIPHTIHCRWL